MSVAMLGCDPEVVDMAVNESDLPFPRDTHSLLPPPEGERVAVSRFPSPTDEQPLEFDHSIHASSPEEGGLGMDCQYCHFNVRKSIHAGVPASQVCQGCHKMVDKTDRPALLKLEEYWAAKEPVPWVKVHDLPDFVHFDHTAHVVRAGIECSECHGAMEERTVAVRENSLEMGWCLNCHKNHPSVDENYGTDAQLRRAELKDCYTCHK